ncbi:hypothetical protein [Serratia marcescens]|uniref:hypothetical protein n=1 Tax=Serratia marcescens TaxID=615 RepID=UPI001F5B7576|nr:hypothetical protein [Serratia marcescens]
MLQAAQQLMRRQGIRRLLVLSGEPEWCREQAQRLAATLPGDWPWVGENPPGPACRLRSRAGAPMMGAGLRLHAVLDAGQVARRGGVAALCGALRAGSWLLLLTPPWRQWPQLPDGDSLRWSDCPQPITTPHFIHHLQHHLADDSEVTVWRQDEPLTLAALPAREGWQPPDGGPTEEQQAILTALLQAESGVWVLTAPPAPRQSTLAAVHAWMRSRR